MPRRRRKPTTKRIGPVRIFVAHSSKDGAISERIAQSLKSKGFEVWYDKWEIKVGESITERIGEGLKQGDFLVVVLSRNSVASRWVQKELSIALVMELETKSIFVLPVRIDDCEIPVSIQDKKYADFRESFDEGLDELLDAIGAPVLPTITAAVVPPRDLDIRKLVDSFSTLIQNEMPTRIAALTTEQKKKVIIEIMDKLSVVEYHQVSGLAYLFTALDLAARENNRACVELFEVVFREFAYRSLPFCREDVMRILAKHLQFSDVRNWVKEQNLTDWFVAEFERSPTYREGAINSEIVANLQPILGKDHLERIAEAASTNNQIYESWAAPQHLRRLFALCDKRLTYKQRTELKKRSLI